MSSQTGFRQSSRLVKFSLQIIFLFLSWVPSLSVSGTHKKTVGLFTTCGISNHVSYFLIGPIFNDVAPFQDLSDYFCEHSVITTDRTDGQSSKKKYKL